MDLSGLLAAQPARLSILSAVNRGRGGTPVAQHAQPQPPPLQQRDGWTAGTPAAAVAARPAPMPMQQQPQQDLAATVQRPRQPLYSGDSDLAEPRAWSRPPAPVSMGASAESYRGPPPQAARAAVNSSQHSSFGFLSPASRSIAAQWQIAPAAVPYSTTAIPYASAAAPFPTSSSASSAAAAVSLYSAVDDSFDVSFSGQQQSDNQSSHFAQSLAEQNAQLERQRRQHAERMAEAERLHPALPPARPYTAPPVPLSVPSLPVSRYLRPEDDPDEDVQVSSDDESEEESRHPRREPERRSEQRREASLSPEPELQSSRSRTELPNYARPTRQERRRRSSTSRSPVLIRESSRPRPRSRSRTRSPPQSPPRQKTSNLSSSKREDSSPPRLSSLSRVYDLLGENQQFYASRTQRGEQTAAAPGSPRQLFHGTLRDGRLDVHSKNDKHLHRESDEPAVHVHVHMHPSPRPADARQQAERNDDSMSTVPVQSTSMHRRSVSFHGDAEPQSAGAAATIASLPTQKSALKPQASAEPAAQEPTQQHPHPTPSPSDSALGMSDLSDSGAQHPPHSKAQPRAQAPVVEDASEDERENFPNFAAAAPARPRARPPQSMMAITRAPVGSSAQSAAHDSSPDDNVASSLRTLKTRKSKPLTPYEPSSSYRRPGPGGAAGGTASAFTVIGGSSTTSAAVTNPQAQGSDVGIFMPSSSTSAASSTNKLALNSARAAKDKTKITGHTAAVIARLHSVARAPPKPSQCAISLLGSKAAAEIAQEAASLHATHAHALHMHEPNPSLPPTHPARASPLKSRQVKHTFTSGPGASATSAAATKPNSASAAPAPLRVDQQPATSNEAALPTPSPLPQLSRQPSAKPQQQPQKPSAQPSQEQQQQQQPQAQPSHQQQQQQLVRRPSLQAQQQQTDPDDPAPPSQPDPAMADLMRQLAILQAASQPSTAATSAVTSAAVSAVATPRSAVAVETEEERDVILEPRMKDAASSPSRFTFERELRPSMHQRSASAVSTTSAWNAPPAASSGRPPLMRSASLPQSPPPAELLESGRPSGRSSPAPTTDEQKQQRPSLQRASTVRSHEASTASSRAVSRQPSRSRSRGRSPSTSPRKSAASGSSTARSPRSLSSPRSDIKGPSIRPALSRSHSRSSSWLPSAAELATAQPSPRKASKSPRASPSKPPLVRSASVGAARAPSITRGGSNARRVDTGLESWSQPPSSVRSHAAGGGVVGNGYLLEVDEDDESQPNTARSARSQPISVVPLTSHTPRSAMRTTGVPAADAAAAAPVTASAPVAAPADVLSQVSNTLLQSLLAMGLQQDPRSRELAQSLLASIAAGQRSAISSAAATPLTQPAPRPSFVPPLQLPSQGAQQPSSVRPTMHHRRQSSVTFAGYPAADLTPSPVPSDGEQPNTFVFPEASQGQGRRGSAPDVASSFAPTVAPSAAPTPVSLLQPPPHPMNELLEATSSRPLSRLAAPSASVLAPTQSTLLRERGLAQAQQLLTTKMKSAAPVVLMKRKKKADEEEAVTAPPPVTSAPPPSRAATAASLSLHRCQSLRRVRAQQSSIDSIHQEQLAMLWSEMRTLRVQIAKLHREIEEDALYHLYLKKKYTRAASVMESGSAEETAPLDHDALISEVGTLELDPDLFARNPTLQSLHRQERLLYMQLCFFCLSHAAACAKLRRASTESIDGQVTLARVAAGFKEWKLIAQRVPGADGTSRRQRAIPSHSEAREHMELWKQTRAVRKWTALGSRAAVMRDKLAALLAMRSARAQSALYHCWRARVLALYRERMQYAMATAFCDRMRRARDFRSWRMRASRERFLYWQLQRAMEAQAEARAIEPPRAAAPPMLLPAPTAAAPQKEKSGFKRSTLTSVAKQRIAAIQQQVQQRKAKATKAPAAAPRKPATAAAAGAAASTATRAVPSGPSPLDELAALEAEAPALSKYFLDEVRRELLASAAAGRAIPSDALAQMPAATDSTVAVAQALERVRAAAGGTSASASSASSLWLRVLAHAFRSQDAPFHLEQIRWIEAQLKLRLEQESSIGWIIRKYHAQLEQRAEAEEVAVIRRRVESERNSALRGVSKPMAELQPQQQQLGRIVHVPPPVVAPAPAAAPASAAPLYSHSVSTSPVKAPRSSADLSASSPATPIQSRTMPAHSPVRAPIALLMDRDATAPLPAESDRARSPAQPRRQSQQPTSPLLDRAQSELLVRQADATEAQLQWEREQAVRERAALEDEWIASHMHRESSSRDASASSSVAEEGDAHSLSRVSERDSDSTTDHSHLTDADAESATAASASVSDWLRQYDLPDPDEAEAEVEALMYEQQHSMEQTSDTAAADGTQQEEAERDGDVSRQAPHSYTRDDSRALARPVNSSAVSLLHSAEAEQHLHVHHFSSALESHSDRSMLVAAALPSATVDRIETRLDSLQSSVDDLQHSLSESFYRQQQQEMHESRTQLTQHSQTKHESSFREPPSRDRSASPLPLQLRSPARSSRPLPSETASLPDSSFAARDPLRSRANIFWAVSTYGKVFRAWLTRALLRHLERKANKVQEEDETKQRGDADDRSNEHSQSMMSTQASASSDPELTEALSEPSSFAAAGPSLSASSSRAASFHSSRSGRPIDPALLQPVYPELLSQPAVKHVLEESLLEAERLEESMEHSRHSLETPVRDRVRFAPTPRSAEPDAPAEASLDELMFARFKRSTDRKAQLQLERILLKTPPTAVTPTVVAPPRQATSAAPSAAAPSGPPPSHLLRPSDLRDLLASSLASSKQSAREKDRPEFKEPAPQSAATVGAPVRRIVPIQTAAPSVKPPSAFAALPPAPSVPGAAAAGSSSSHPPSVTLAAFTDLSFTPGSSFGFSSNLPSFQSSIDGAAGDDAAVALASGATAPSDAPSSAPARPSPDPSVSAYVAAASSSSYHPPPRPLPRLAVNFAANKLKQQNRA